MRDDRPDGVRHGSEWGYLGKPLVSDGEGVKGKHFSVRVTRATFAAFHRYALANKTTPTDLLADFIDGALTQGK